jgi:hypothetical protein
MVSIREMAEVRAAKRTSRKNAAPIKTVDDPKRALEKKRNERQKIIGDHCQH